MERAGETFRRAVAAESPLQVVGVLNALMARLAQQAGFQALYLSGAGVANWSHGLPDLAVTHLGDVAEDARCITAITTLPLLVDIDTGWGSMLMIQRAIRTLEEAGVAAVHIEDQQDQKRCGHRPNKSLITASEMCARLQAAVEARRDPSFVVMARTDAVAQEGLEQAIKRSQHYIEAGADMLFAEALTDLESYRLFCAEVSVPVLANITEFGKTPLFTLSELDKAGVALALYPLSAARAMAHAAENVYSTIREEGTQRRLLDQMQTREELYALLDYHQQEAVIDQRREP